MCYPASPCNAKSVPLVPDDNSLPNSPAASGDDDADDNGEPSNIWDPFANRPAFAFAELIYERMQASKGNVNQLLDIWAVHAMLEDNNGEPIFQTHQELLDMINTIKCRDTPFFSFSIHYPGPVDENAPEWKCEKWTIHAPNSQVVFQQMTADTSTDGHFNTRPYIELETGNKCVYSNVMSGDWAYRQAL